MHDLPEELVAQIVAATTHVAMLTLRACSHTLYELVGRDRKWLPIIGPPSFAHTTLSIEEHGAYLIRLFARYQLWLARWRELEGE